MDWKVHFHLIKHESASKCFHGCGVKGDGSTPWLEIPGPQYARH